MARPQLGLRRPRAARLRGARILREAGRVLRRLNADQRLAVAGVAVIAASLPLPWWRAPTDDDLVVTGIGDFGWVEGALVLTAVMVVLLVLRVGAGHVPPRPLREWALLLVAFGQPKGERWIDANYRSLGVPVCVQVGASLDFAAGRVRRAPRWLQRSGLEWAYRLALEPRRLFGRYFQNGMFLLGRLACGSRALGPPAA